MTAIPKLETITRQPRHRLWLLAGLGALTLLVGTATLRAQQAPPDTPEETVDAAPLPVDVLTAAPVSNYSVTRTYTGEISALRASELGFERGGQLVAVLVEEGTRVAPGQPLARLDTSNLATQRRQLEAEKARANAQLAELRTGPRAEDIAAAEAAVRDIEQQLALQQTQRARRESLYAAGAISKEELDEFAFGQGALQARLDQSRSRLQELRNGTRQEQLAAQQALVQQLDASIADIDVTISKSTLTAPFEGIVSTQQADEGTVVAAGQSVIRLVEAAPPEVRIGVPAEVASQLGAGSAQTVALGDTSYGAAVTAVLPEVDPVTRTQPVLLTLERAGNFSPGQTARLELTDTVATPGFWLPTDALTQGIRGLWTCYVLVATDAPEVYAVEPKSVEVLHQDGNRVLVQGTLAAGDTVVASGAHRLVPGQRVWPLETIAVPGP